MADNFQEWIERAKDIAELSKATDAPGWLARLLRGSKNPPPGQLDWRGEAVEALRENAVQTFANITLTVDQAISILGPDFDWDKLAEPSRTWSNHWLSATSKIAEDDIERRVWWSHLLAAEIQQSGTFSLRTIAIMDVLSPDEAQLFTKLAPYIWLDQSATGLVPVQRRILIMPSDASTLWRPSVNEGLALQSAGLVARQAVGYSTPVDVGEQYSMKLENKVITLAVTKPARILRGPLILTEEGEQISRLMDGNLNQQYLDELLEAWSEFAEVSIVG